MAETPDAAKDAATKLAAKDQEIATLKAQLAQSNAKLAEKTPAGSDVERELIKALVNGPVRVDSLPSNLRQPEVLISLFAQSKIEFGRPEHWFDSDKTPAEEVSTRMKGSPKLRIGTGPGSWMTKGERSNMPVSELLKRDKDQPDPIKLLVRLAA